MFARYKWNADRRPDSGDAAVLIDLGVRPLDQLTVAFDAGQRPHVGTLDVDLGLAIGILNEQRYHEVCERLRSAGFHPDKNDQGNETNQRWKIETGQGDVTVDFLIPPTNQGDNAGTLRNLEKGFAAIITQGLDLAFRDREIISLDGTTILSEHFLQGLPCNRIKHSAVLSEILLVIQGDTSHALNIAANGSGSASR